VCSGGRWGGGGWGEGWRGGVWCGGGEGNSGIKIYTSAGADTHILSAEWHRDLALL
jgi:hypothetical protein